MVNLRLQTKRAYLATCKPALEMQKEFKDTGYI
jgi:hypothetical protein